MLVLTRKSNQKIYVGDNIVIHVLESRSDGSVRLGFEAPRDVRIQRAELVDAVSGANVEAASGADTADAETALLEFIRSRGN